MDYEAGTKCPCFLQAIKRTPFMYFSLDNYNTSNAQGKNETT